MDTLLAGLESHGFRESPSEPWEPRRFTRLGREDRFLCADGSICIQGIGTIPPDSDYHKLLQKCGEIILRTRRDYPPKSVQQPLALNADELLGELGGSDGK